MSPVLVQYWAGCPESANARWTRTLHEIRECARQGWRTHLVWSRLPDDASLWQPFAEVGCDIVIHPRPRRSFDPACIWRTYRWLRSVKCDVFHCHNQHTSPLIGAALAGVPVRLWSKLAMSQQYEEGGHPERAQALMPSVRVSCLLAHHVLAVSQAVRQELLQLGVGPEKVTVSPGGIDLDAYRLAGDEVLRDFGFDSAHAVITTVGHAVPVKGWDVLLRAFAIVAEAVPHARLLLVGGIDGPSEVSTFRALRALADELGVSNRVCFAGRRADVPRVLASSHIFVLPSRSEGHPNALKEAMAAGLACIGSRVGGVPELLADDRTGLMFDREDHSALARLVRRLLDDQALRYHLAQGAQHAAGAFALDLATRRTLDLYARLLNGRGKPAFAGGSSGVN